MIRSLRASAAPQWPQWGTPGPQPNPLLSPTQPAPLGVLPVNWAFTVANLSYEDLGDLLAERSTQPGPLEEVGWLLVARLFEEGHERRDAAALGLCLDVLVDCVPPEQLDRLPAPQVRLLADGLPRLNAVQRAIQRPKVDVLLQRLAAGRRLALPPGPLSAAGQPPDIPRLLEQVHIGCADALHTVVALAHQPTSLTALREHRWEAALAQLLENLFQGRLRGLPVGCPIPALVTCLELASCQGPALLHLHCLPYLTLLLQLVYNPDGVAYFSILGFAADGVKERRLQLASKLMQALDNLAHSAEDRSWLLRSSQVCEALAATGSPRKLCLAAVLENTTMPATAPRGPDPLALQRRLQAVGQALGKRAQELHDSAMLSPPCNSPSPLSRLASNDLSRRFSATASPKYCPPLPSPPSKASRPPESGRSPDGSSSSSSTIHRAVRPGAGRRPTRVTVADPPRVSETSPNGGRLPGLRTIIDEAAQAEDEVSRQLYLDTVPDGDGATYRFDPKTGRLMVAVVMVCGNTTCSVRETADNPFPVCSQCKQIAYCSRRCQKAHWKEHKPQCTPAAAEAGASSPGSAAGRPPASPGPGPTADRHERAEEFKKQGNTFYHDRDFSSALEAYTQALDLVPDAMVYALNIAAVHFAQREYLKCVQFCERAIHAGDDPKLLLKAYSRLSSALVHCKGEYCMETLAAEVERSHDVQLSLRERSGVELRAQRPVECHGTLFAGPALLWTCRDADGACAGCMAAHPHRTCPVFRRRFSGFAGLLERLQEFGAEDVTAALRQRLFVLLVMHYLTDRTLRSLLHCIAPTRPIQRAPADLCKALPPESLALPPDLLDGLWAVVCNTARPMPDVEGLGLALPVALLRHSCSPNCHVFSEGRMFYVRTLTTVRKGEPLTACMTPYYLNKVQRQYMLSRMGLTCACERCSAGEDLRLYRCPNRVECNGKVRDDARCDECGTAVDDERMAQCRQFEDSCLTRPSSLPLPELVAPRLLHPAHYLILQAAVRQMDFLRPEARLPFLKILVNVACWVGQETDEVELVLQLAQAHADLHQPLEHCAYLLRAWQLSTELFGEDRQRVAALRTRLAAAVEALPADTPLIPHFARAGGEGEGAGPGPDVVPFLRRFVLEVVGPEAEHEADRRLLQWWDRQVGRAHPGSLRRLVAALALARLTAEPLLPLLTLAALPEGNVYAVVQWAEAHPLPPHVIGAYHNPVVAKRWAHAAAHRCRRGRTPIHVSLSHLGSYALDLPAVQRVYITVFECPSPSGPGFHLLLRMRTVGPGRSCELLGAYGSPEEAAAVHPSLTLRSDLGPRDGHCLYAVPFAADPFFVEWPAGP